MAPPMQLAAHTGIPYIPTSDAHDRHEYGITKNRKLASTGGGRAWSEDEEVYLLQTRLQKMPYKHIAAHLKKTELACRLHYHQLSHGSNRRKRTTSISSGSSAGHSPIMPAAIPSPIRECSSRDITPPGSAGSHDPGSPAYSNSVQLPSIMIGTKLSPCLPSILPKPASMTLSTAAPSPVLGYPTPMPDSARSLGPSPFPQSSPISNGPMLRLDCSLPPPSAHVDVPRLQAIYAAHRSSFWAAIATDYGAGISPIVLEQAWKANMLSAGSQTPITPVASPNDREGLYEKHDRTRISAILGIDANPRSPKEREMVRRLEEERSVSVTAGA
ncbi:Uu.00g077990.m01.CDS01 [Anthostomella pinea]|uniref:Uu.00g077990.m01.CDS01 n=1 Tax=Anthostomella pinea TaxID=933095 RepID=A0AAI8VKL6_9PEZI|nr:Uu.00g077990.m01.CDS01 [Anthostomella pinea]